MRWKLQKVKYHPRGKGFKVELQRPETSQLKLRDVVIGKNRCDFCALLYNFITGAGAMQDELLDKRIVLSSYRDDRVRDDFEMELAINGIRVAFQDHDQIELETKYPVLCQYLPLTKVPGEESRPIIGGLVQSDMQVCRSIWIPILRRRISRALANGHCQKN